MKRRIFLLSGLAALSGAGAYLALAMHPEDTIAMVLRKRLDYLQLEPEGVARFARDLLAKHVLSNARTRVLSAARSVYSRFSLSSGTNSLAYLLRHGEDRIVASYLISSDFFVQGADETRVVQYLGLLDSRRACANPFAQRMV